MGRLGDLVASHRLDAALAWGGTLLLAGAAVRFVGRGDPEWAVFALLTVGVTLVPPLVARDATVTFPAELVALVALPVLVRAAGVFPGATPFLAAAGLALLSAIALETYTSLEMTPRFAVVLTVITTMAFAGAWAVGTWIADAALGTAYLGGKTELMWDLTTATAMGVVAGLVFEGYFGYTDRLDRLRPGTAADRATGPSAAASRDRPAADARHRLSIRGMQAILAAVVALALSGPTGACSPTAPSRSRSRSCPASSAGSTATRWTSGWCCG